MRGKLTRKLTTKQLEDVRRWWHSLSRKERDSLREERFPSEICARFEEPGEEEALEIPDDFYEYVVAHELTLWPTRTFTICSAHEEARVVVAHGLIPADFVCPLSKVDCPMRVLLAEAAGKNVRLQKRCA